MIKIRFGLKGLTPLLVHKEPPFEESKGKAKPPKRHDEAMAIAEKFLHLALVNGSKKPVPVMPGINIQKAVQAMYTFMPGRKGGWKKVIRCVSVVDEYLPIIPGSWTLDSRRAGQGGAMLYRPRFDQWLLQNGTFLVDDRHISEEEARQLADYAGAYNGLGSWRIGAGGPMGKFMITDWEVIGV